jgi:hypothetical protein
MGFRFRRSLKILPGVRLNLSGSGASVSLGPRGFHYTIGPKGTRVTAGIPGTGLSWTQYTPHSPKHQPSGQLPSPLDIPVPQRHDALEVVQSAAAKDINALSTSELAPMLDSAKRRFRLAPIVLLVSIVLFIAMLVQGNQFWIGMAALGAAIFVPAAVLLDRYRRSVKVTFEADGATGRVAEALTVAFNELARSNVAWVVQAEGGTADWKRNAGATKLTRRSETRLTFGKPDCIRGGAKFPAFTLGPDELYLLPDAALAIVRGSVAAVSFRELEFTSASIRFVEEERVPSDAPVVDQTWRYVSKSGGPDRRFNNNAQLPVCLYGELTFRSPGGLNCKLHLSNPSVAEPLSKVLDVLKHTKVELPGSATYVRPPNRWPTIAFALAFALLDTLLLANFDTRSLGNLANPSSRQPSVRPTPALTIAPAPEPAGPRAASKNLPSAPTASPSPLDIKPLSNAANGEPPPRPDNSPDALDLNDPQNVRWLQSRLRDLGFLRGGTSGWDSFSRSALRDFKATNNLGADDKFDRKSQEVLSSGAPLSVQQTFIGAWSEEPCTPGSKPDIHVNSRRATSSAGGICEFNNVRAAASGWIAGATCSNAGERWTANIRLAVNGGKLVWIGRDGSETQYFRCQ